jgi:L-lysine 2,3-aminomutase
MIMKANIFGDYLNELLKADLPTLDTIRIGTKSLSYWPYKFTHDGDADEMLRLFEKTVKSGKQLAFMAHFNHPRELETKAVQEAIRRIRNTGAVIRTQSPILNHINNDADVWADMWDKQLRLGIIPYYMFIVRDTGAQHYFEIPLVKAWELYHKAYKQVSGLGRTARGPSMSADPGKVCVLGPTQVNGEKVLALTMLQGRNPDWVYRPFFAKYDENAMWLDDLEPAFGDKFFYEDELKAMYQQDTAAASANNV